VTLRAWTPEEQDRHAADLEDAADPVKWCPTCQHTKALTDFAVDRRRGDGRRWQCRPCSNAADRARDVRRRQAKAAARGEPPPTCANCTAGSHGHWCVASLFGPWCPCGCRAVLGLAGPFDGSDPTVPWWDERYQGVA
jgi:hypothetical protein